MALRGPTFYPQRTQTDSPPAGLFDLNTAVPASASTTPSLAGSTSSATTYRITPSSSGITGTSTSAGTNVPANVGWWIAPTTDMAATASAQRVIRAGSTVAVQCSVTATGLAGNDVVTVSLYKRSAAGVATFVQANTANAANGATGTTTAVTVNVILAADLVFAAGETLQVELYLQVAQQTVTAGSATLTLSSATPWTIQAPNGIAYRILSSASDSAPAADTSSRKVIRPRAVTDSAPAADSVTRRLTVARFPADSAPAADTNTRQLTLVRRTTENIGAGGSADYPVTTPATITGIVTKNGTPQAGAVCRLLRDSDEYLAGTVTTGADGKYVFTRDKFDPNTYHVEAYVGTTLHGLTDRGLVPS